MKTVKPKKFLGQHFLKDLKIAQDIADTVDACPGIPVLEVGPGMISNPWPTYVPITPSWKKTS